MSILGTVRPFYEDMHHILSNPRYFGLTLGLPYVALRKKKLPIRLWPSTNYKMRPNIVDVKVGKICLLALIKYGFKRKLKTIGENKASSKLDRQWYIVQNMILVIKKL